MKRRLFYALTIAAALGFASCSNDGGKEHEGTDSTKTDGSASAENQAPAKGKYPVKSGIITYETDMMGMKVPITLYFDDYGNKECQETITEMEMMGTKVKTHSMNITKDGYSYELNMIDKTGKKMKSMPASTAPGGIDFSKLSEDMMKQMHITKGGNENVCGKDCSVFSIDNADMKMKGTFAVWNNIPLKSSIDLGGMPMLMNATKVEENASIPADKFEVPSDIKMTEF
jgi:hypothetical protein